MSRSAVLRTLPVVLAGAVLMTATMQAGASAAPAAASIDAGSTNFGSTVQLLPQEKWVDAIAREESTVGGLGNVRVFQTVPVPSVLQAVGARSGIFSFDLPPAEVLAGNYDAQFQAFFAAAPKDHTTWWNYFHEADVAHKQGRNPDLAKFRAASAHVATLARAAGNARLKDAVILVGWSASPYSGVNIADYLPDDRTLVDLIAYDNYNDGAIRQGIYGDPTNMINLDKSAAAAVGKPFAVAEFGSVVLGSDYTGRAAWIQNFSQIAANSGAVFVSYYDSDQYGSGNEFRLLDAPSQAAYRAVLNSTHATAPSVPKNVTVTSGSASAVTSWQSPDENGSPLTGYTVTATNDSTGAVSTQTTGAAATTATLSPLSDGQSYTVRVTATNGAGTGPAAAVTGVVPGQTVTAPDAPTAGTATAGTGSATLTWTAPASNGGSSVSSYTVSAVDSVTGAATSATVAGDLRTGTVLGLTNGRSYLLKVVATNAVGSSPSSAATAVTPFAAPGAPTVGRATGGNAAATVTWTAPGSNGGAAVTGYTLNAVNPTNGAVLATAQVDGSQTSGTVTGLVNGKSYAVTVTASNGLTGPASGRSNTVVPATVTATPLAYSFGGNSTDAVISATAWWKTPTTNGGSPITGWRVTTYQYSGSTVVSTKVSPVQPGASRKLSVEGLVKNATYRFTVTAINGVGASAPSALTDLATAR